MRRTTRRDWMRGTLGAALAGTLGAAASSTRTLHAADEPLPVAGVVTVYHPNSHADVLLGKILSGWRQDGGAGPALKLVSVYADQAPKQDMSRTLAERHGFRIAKSIDEALTGGGERLQVAGVLSIGEHGDYPFTPDTQQHQYPRRRFLDEIAATFERCGRSVPVFNDKHLGYRWEDARHMVETARRLKFPLLAGSSIPVAWRYPALDLPLDAEVEAALSIGYGGFEAYGFHAIEGHQCLLERRRGGETGVRRIQAVRGAEVLAAEKQGAWSRELLDAALATLPGGATKKSADWTPRDNSAAYLLEHRDGLRSTVLMANGLSDQFAFAAKLKGRAEPWAVWIKLQDGKPYGHFAYLLRAIERTIHDGKGAYPVERTLLTTGILDRVMQSIAADGKTLDTPELDVVYRSADWPFANRSDSPLELPNS